MKVAVNSKLPTVTGLTCQVLNVNARTNWSYIGVQTSDDQTYWGEASLNGWEPLLQGAVAMLRNRLMGLRIDQVMAQLTVSPLSPGGLVYNSVISAVAQAMLEWQAWHHQQAWHVPLGTMRRQKLRVYANINRATENRSPEGFAATARRAAAQGFTAFKAAPFDELTPALCGTLLGQQRLHHGITCILAMREAIGPHARLMLDCHWRLDEPRAHQLLKDLAPAQLHWLECPLPEIPQNSQALRQLRQVANSQGVLTAGAETLIGVQGFQPLFDAGTYDVVMPDVKYCGGPWVMLQIAQRARESGVQFSPHNPTGPLASLHSINVASVAPECDMIELQFQESPLFDSLLTGVNPPHVQGTFDAPLQQGMRAPLNLALFKEYPYTAVPVGVENLAMGSQELAVTYSE